MYKRLAFVIDVIALMMALIYIGWIGNALANTDVTVPAEVATVGQGGLIYWLVNIIKGFLCKKEDDTTGYKCNQILPLVSIVIAIALNFVTNAYPDWWSNAYNGIITALATTGAYRTGTVWKETKD